MEYVLITETADEMQVLAELFRHHGLEVVTAIDSGEVVARVLERDPKVILMTEDMPTVESVELLTLLRRLTNARIIVVSIGARRTKGVIQNADRYLTRPINFQDVYIQVSGWLEQS